MTARILAAALRDIRGAADHATAIDAADAAQLAAALKRLGWSLVPTELDDAMRLTIWRAQGKHMRLTRAGFGIVDAEAFAADRAADPLQRQQDQAAWSAALAEAETRDG